MELKDLINDKLTISINRFSKEIGISRQTIYKIFAGKCTPSVLTVKKICEFFGEDYHDYI